jgi:nitrous oxidase accessory protein NosD
MKKGVSIEKMWLEGQIILVKHSYRGGRAKKKMNSEEGKNVGLFLAFVVLFASRAFVSISTASASTIYVPDQYAKIQWAVDNASAGDTIVVRDGIYYENVRVNRRLAIRSENGAENCIVQAANFDNNVFYITADTGIIGLTIQGSGNDGIYVRESSLCVENAAISGNNGHGLYPEGKKEFTLRDSAIENNGGGVTSLD